ncbi:MAG: hypothetical protein RL748_2043 [Pseudomonadota bacterium]|jgi:hypothetical protein
MLDNHLNTALAAAKIFSATTRKVLGSDHAETLIASIARSAGSLMYKSFNFDHDIAAGTRVMSEQANQYGPQMMDLMLTTLQKLGHNVREADINPDFASGESSHISLQQAQEQLLPFFLTYCEASKMSHFEAALAAAMATGITIFECRETLAPEQGASIAVFGFVEGSKTAPWPEPANSAKSTEAQPGKSSAPKKWYQLW